MLWEEVKSYLPIHRKSFMTMSGFTKRLWLFEVTAEPAQTGSGPEQKFFLQIEGTSMILRVAVWMSVVCCAMGRGRQGTSQRFSIAIGHQQLQPHQEGASATWGRGGDRPYLSVTHYCSELCCLPRGESGEAVTAEEFAVHNQSALEILYFPIFQVWLGLDFTLNFVFLRYSL